MNISGNFALGDKASEILKWENRKLGLMHEISQYDADIVTLQECDHYNDFFRPKMAELGYIGCFASKPTSGCLEVRT